MQNGHVLGALGACLLFATGCASGIVSGATVSTTTGSESLQASYLRTDAAGTQPLVILLHDPRDEHDSHDWDRIWEGLHGEGYGLLAVDLQGFGATGGAGPADETGWADDLLAWLRWADNRANAPASPEPINLGRIAVLGMGKGGSLAAAAAAVGLADCAGAVSPRTAEVQAYAETLTGDPAVRLQLANVLFQADGDHEDTAADIVELSELTTGSTEAQFGVGDAYGFDVFEGNPALRDTLCTWCWGKF